MKKKSTRNSKGCGLCKPYKRAGNSTARYKAKESAKREEMKESAVTYTNRT